MVQTLTRVWEFGYYKKFMVFIAYGECLRWILSAMDLACDGSSAMDLLRWISSVIATFMFIGSLKRRFGGYGPDTYASLCIMVSSIFSMYRFL